jgi:hypothetical protein
MLLFRIQTRYIELHNVISGGIDDQNDGSLELAFKGCRLTQLGSAGLSALTSSWRMLVRTQATDIEPDIIY